MPFAKTCTVTVTAPPPAARASVPAVVEDLGYELTGAGADGELTFRAKRRFLRAELEGSVRIAAHGAGSSLEVEIQTAPHETTGILDGRRNQKSVDELAQRIAGTLDRA